MPVRLSEVRAGSSCTIVEIAGGLRVRQHLAKLGVLLGVEIVVQEEAGSGGGLLLGVRGQKVGVRRTMAAKVLVELRK